MIIKKIKINNIRSYKNLELDFPTGTTLLSGDIGTGKTSILLALQFAIFGLQPGQKGASILRHGEDGASVNLLIDIDGKEIEIDRSLKRNKGGGITQEEGSLRINHETQEISTSELKTKILSLLEYPKEFAKKSDLLYKFTVYTPQEGMKEIINERPETRLDLVRHIFGIDRYKRIKENTQILLQRIKENVKIKEVYTREINNIREKLSMANEEKIKVSKDVLGVSTILEKTKAEKDIYSKELEELKKALEEKNILDIEKSKKEGELLGKKMLKFRLEKEIASSKNQLTGMVEFSQESLEKTKIILEKHKKILEELNQKLMDINSKIYSFRIGKESSISLKDKIVSLENCPTCFQSVGIEHKEKLSKKTQFEIEEIDRDLEQKIIEKTQLNKDIDAERELMQKYEQDFNLLEKDKIKFEHQRVIDTKIKSDLIILDRTYQEIAMHESMISEISEKTLSFQELKKDYDLKKEKFCLIDMESRKLDIRLAEKRKELEMLKKQIDQMDLEIFQKEIIRGHVSHLRELQAWIEERFSPLVTITEKNVLTTIRKDFSKIFNEWFSALVSDSLSVRLDEDFTPIISNQDYELDYDFLSGGERTAVALAYRLALNQTINSFLSKLKTKDLLILDEPTDGFSEQQLDKMRDIFEQLQAKQIILVSHEQKIEGFVDNIIRIKKDGISKIENVN